SPLPGRPYGASLFTFVGKRGGHAILNVRVDSPQRPQSAFSVLVRPSAAEMLRDSLLLATPLGALAGFALWYFFKYELKDAATLGAVAGGAFGLLAFFFNYLRFRRAGTAGG
ncbi:MAG TPA: hypothetical protein VF508_01560, partial [Pyrinomonadaceae bacterium]